mmetsp:Transcript_48273/g.86040  ORF Transcript_48273/g.86040 Transcript_48273/m.86040 type:complete len:92 (+) Transcript_48273:174-449(+)
MAAAMPGQHRRKEGIGSSIGHGVLQWGVMWPDTQGLLLDYSVGLSGTYPCPSPSSVHIHGAGPCNGTDGDPSLDEFCSLPGDVRLGPVQHL